MASTEESSLATVPSAEGVNLPLGDSESSTKDVAADTNTKNGEGVCLANPNPAATIFCLQSRLNEQLGLNRKLRQEKDKQLTEIAASLILLESRLRTEQKRLVQLLDDKDNKIAEQETCIQALLNLNRKLSSRLATVLRHPKEKACECAQTETCKEPVNPSCTVAQCDEKTDDVDASETSDDTDNDDDDGGDEDEDDGDSVTWGSLAEGELVSPVKRSLPNLRRGSAVHGTWSSSSIERAKMVCPKHPNVERLRRAAGVSRGPNLSVVYNRVMSNHRSVTKPKDVKYKKISRVKSRSLEELRGRLKILSQPAVNGSFFVPPTNFEHNMQTPITL